MREYYVDFMKYKRNRDAAIALEEFKQYYEKLPEGELACNALAFRANIFIELGERALASQQLRLLQQRPSFLEDCVDEIDYIESRVDDMQP